MPASTCWLWVAAIRAPRPASDLASIAVIGSGASHAASDRGVARLERDVGLRQAVPHRLELGDRTAELLAGERVVAGETEHGAPDGDELGGERPPAGEQGVVPRIRREGLGGGRLHRGRLEP